MKPLTRPDRDALRKVIRIAHLILAVGCGEPIARVAKRYGLSVNKVRELYRSRLYFVRKGAFTAEARLKGNRAGVAALKKKADEAYVAIYPIVTKLRAEGQTLRAIAAHLDGLGSTRLPSPPLAPEASSRM
jgi:hypothetical protein